MRNRRIYFTLITLEDGRWYPQFGDYSRNVVVQEMEDSYSDDICRIICTASDQLAVENAITSLNFELETKEERTK